MIIVTREIQPLSELNQKWTLRSKQARGVIPKKAAAFCLFPLLCARISFIFSLCTFHVLFLLSYQSMTPHCPSSHQSCLSPIGRLLWREFLWSGLSRRLWACGHWHSLDRPKERPRDWPRSGFLTLTHYWGPQMSKNVTYSENEGRRWWVSAYKAI